MRKSIVLGVVLLLLVAGAFLAVYWLVPAEAPRTVQAPPVAVPDPPTQGLVMAPAPTDPAEIDRLGALEEARARYAALRDAFGSARPSSASRSRLEPALRSLWPTGRRWELACAGLVCRVTPRDAPERWGAELAEDPGVRQVTERLVFDPEAAMAPAYLLLFPETARPEPAEKADQFLREIEAAVRESPEVARCLADIEPGRALVLDLRVDGTGLTYRMGAGLGPGPSLCASMALGEFMAVPVPPGTRAGSRTVTLQRP
ncbi:MAG: hypothetical protein IPO09_07715 [Anaeromyxobacter sp.]|nr:hypothetical protein [Anaeromyxobacter sp.]MBL0277859.1 hypothetical protein [Anaeromyxobacter sp.]